MASMQAFQFRENFTYYAKSFIDGFLINPLIPESFYSTPHEMRSEEELSYWWGMTYIEATATKVTVWRLDGSTPNQPTPLNWFETLDDALVYAHLL